MVGELKTRVYSQKKVKQFQKGDVLFERGADADGIYVIVRGMVEEEFESGWTFPHSRGSEVGYANILSAENKNYDKYTNKSTATATMAGEYWF